MRYFYYLLDYTDTCNRCTDVLGLETLPYSFVALYSGTFAPHFPSVSNNIRFVWGPNFLNSNSRKYIN